MGGEEGRLQVREPDWEASRIGIYYVRFQIITTIIRKKNIKNRLNISQLTKAVQNQKGLQQSVTTVPGGLKLSSDLLWHQEHMWYTETKHPYT